MGFISDFIGGFTGSAGKKAARKAGAIQAEAQQKAIKTIQTGTEEARAPLESFATAGQDTIGGLVELITNPEAQRNFIIDNPFFDALKDEATRTLLNNQAARGKVGSGETAEALQESFILLGADLLNQNIGQRQNLITGIGLPASQGISGLEERETVNVANLQVGIGESAAAGEVGAARAITEGAGRIVDTGLRIAGISL